MSKLPITIMDKGYILSAAMMYIAGVTDEDVGQYIAGIKINDRWEIFDDLKKKSEEISPNKAMEIQVLLYLKR